MKRSIEEEHDILRQRYRAMRQFLFDLAELMEEGSAPIPIARDGTSLVEDLKMKGISEKEYKSFKRARDRLRAFLHRSE